MQLLRRYILYLIRWQCSTPILAPIIAVFKHSPIWGTKEDWIGAIVANLVGGLIFFWVDRWIFKKTDILRGEVWEIQQDIVCADCGTIVDRGYRLAKASNYDHTNDKRPEFRCKKCSLSKYERDWGKPADSANLPIDDTTTK
ncbi:MAG: hypothetical protein WC562_05265 [Dehalococcoidia bacterium]